MKGESGPAPEHWQVTDQEAVEALPKLESDPYSREVYERWLLQAQSEIDAIYESEGSRAAAVAGIRWTMRKASVFHEAGFTGEAIDELLEICSSSGSKMFQGMSLYDEAAELLKKIRGHGPVYKK